MSMMEIAIHGNMDVSTVTKWPPEEIASEAYGQHCMSNGAQDSGTRIGKEGSEMDFSNSGG